MKIKVLKIICEIRSGATIKVPIHVIHKLRSGCIHKHVIIGALKGDVKAMKAFDNIGTIYSIELKRTVVTIGSTTISTSTTRVKRLLGRARGTTICRGIIAIEPTIASIEAAEHQDETKK